MSRRTVHDFDKLNKLADPTLPKPRSISNYEAYLDDKLVSKTKGLF